VSCRGTSWRWSVLRSGKPRAGSRCGSSPSSKPSIIAEAARVPPPGGTGLDRKVQSASRPEAVILPWRLARLLLQGDDRAEFIPFSRLASALLLSASIDAWGARCAPYNGLPLRALRGDEGAEQCFTSSPAATAPAKVVLAATEHHARVLQSSSMHESATHMHSHSPVTWNARHDIRIY
jgi:hypothetical protein